MAFEGEAALSAADEAGRGAERLGLSVRRQYAAFPRTCIVHLLRHSMRCCAGHKDRNAVAAALKAVYTAVDAEPAEAAPVEFEESDLARQYPAIAPNRRRAWNEVIPFLDYPPGVRRPIHTTDAIEAPNSTIRRAVRTRGHFPSDEAAAKLIDPALNATSTEWKRSAREWHAVKSSSQSCSKNASRWRENAPQNKIPLSLHLPGVAFRRPAPERRHAGPHPGLVDEHRPARGDPASMAPPPLATAFHVRAFTLIGDQRLP